MNFAVIKFAGKQLLVKPGEKLEIEGRMAEEPGDINLSEVLLLNVDDKLQIGAPLVSGATIKAKILDIHKGEKIDVYKFKAKVRYRKHIGFRPFVTTLEIADFGTEKPAQAPKPKTKTK